jgi:hypothetical protein
MTHLLINITGFEIVAPYTLRIIFDDGVERIVNFADVLCGYYYGPLREVDLFNQVRLDPEVHTLVWPNGADFDPATLYNWHQGEGAELAQRAAHWRSPAMDHEGSGVKSSHRSRRTRPEPHLQPVR